MQRSVQWSRHLRHVDVRVGLLHCQAIEARHHLLGDDSVQVKVRHLLGSTTLALLQRLIDHLGLRKPVICVFKQVLKLHLYAFKKMYRMNWALKL